jgi:acylphosphatase
MSESEGPTVVRRRFQVVGRVQGVGFRAWTLRRGTELGLRGTVRNRRDGGVEVEAEGAPDSVERLRSMLQRGPPLAEVREVREVAPSGEVLPTGFDVAF